MSDKAVTRDAYTSRNSLSKLITGKSLIEQKSPWATVPVPCTFVPLDKSLLGQLSLEQMYQYGANLCREVGRLLLKWS